MKGAYSSPDALLYRYTQQLLFPDTTYGVDSGGDPQRIPDLTYEQFKAFHATLYHPSNARIFFYGDDPPAERLRLMADWLDAFEPIAIDSTVALQPHFDRPGRMVRSFAASADNRKAMVTVSWMLGETPDPETALGLNILEHMLIGTPAAPLRKALIDSGLGDDLAASGLNDGLRQYFFSVGMKGIAVENAEAIETLILETLHRLAAEGIDPNTVAASLNTIEFLLRENNTGSLPRGLALMFRALGTWLYDGDPLAHLAFEQPLNAVKARIAAGERYFETLIRTLILDNAHRNTLLLQPDPEQAEREAAAERARLDAVRAAMSAEEVQAVVELTHQLKAMQEQPDAPEDLARIPSLTLADLDRRNKPIPSELLAHNETPILYHDIFTNGIVYLDLGLNLRMLPQDLLPYVGLFGRALTEMGTATEDFVQLSQRIGRSTGGIYATSFTSLTSVGEESATWLMLRGKAAVDQADELLAILRDVLLTVRLDDRERFRQIVLKAKAGKESSLAPSGHSIVATRLRAAFNVADWAAEQMGGISNLFFLRELVQQIDADWPAVLAKLEAVRAALVNRATMVGNVTLDAANWASFAPKLNGFLEALPATEAAPARWSPVYGSGGEGLIIPAQVNYVGKAGNLYQLGYRYHGSAAVINRFLQTSWLWDKVRVQGGAYGGFCSFDRLSGIFSYGSYRDPNLLGTLAVYDQTGAFLRQVALNETDLTRSIIGAINDMDAYQLPDARGYTALVRHLTGVTDAERQRIRDEVLATSAADFRAFADVLDGLRDSALVVVMGAQQAIEAANAARDGLLTPVKVL